MENTTIIIGTKEYDVSRIVTIHREGHKAVANIADIDLNHIIFAKNAADPVGHYSRPDVFQLVFNAQHKPNVIYSAPIVRSAIEPTNVDVTAELEVEGE